MSAGSAGSALPLVQPLQLSAQDWAALGDICQRVHLPQGAPLFAQGDAASGAYFIRAGRVSLSMMLPGGSQQEVATVGPDEVLGEAAWMDQVRRSLTATAVSDVELWFLHRLDFKGLMLGFQPTGFRLTQQIAQLTATRIRQAQRQVTAVAVSAPPPLPDPRPLLPAAGFEPHRQLRQFAFFDTFTDRELAAFSDLCELVGLRRGAIRRAEDSDAPGLTLLVSGAAEVLLAHNDLRLCLLRPGQVQGAGAALLSVAAESYLRAREDALLLTLPSAAMARIMTPDSRLAYKLLLALSVALFERLQVTNLAQARSRRQSAIAGIVPSSKPDR